MSVTVTANTINVQASNLYKATTQMCGFDWLGYDTAIYSVLIKQTQISTELDIKSLAWLLYTGFKVTLQNCIMLPEIYADVVSRCYDFDRMSSLGCRGKITFVDDVTDYSIYLINKRPHLVPLHQKMRN